MGAVSFSVDTILIAGLKKVLPFRAFVETGTFEGDTIEEVLPSFGTIHSVELSEDYYRKVVERFKASPKVHLHLGHSADVLRKLSSELADASVLYWLDAHWCVADKIAGGTSQCPILEELDAIGILGPQSVILIDDARLFLSPPPYPHEVTQWPSFEAVTGKLHALSSGHELMVANDVIIFFPRSVRETVREYAYRNAVDWLQVLFKSKNYDAVKSEFDFLQVQFDGLQRQLVEKDEEMVRLLVIAEERVREIHSLKEIAEERSRVIHLINEDLETIKRHWSYRSLVKLKWFLEQVQIIGK
ncbi:hypothetical protein D4R75_12420 [bacterium]|nr:MAG: hypothetical protein D4R75_12420 [bacterium]